MKELSPQENASLKTVYADVLIVSSDFLDLSSLQVAVSVFTFLC